MEQERLKAIWEKGIFVDDSTPFGLVCMAGFDEKTEMWQKWANGNINKWMEILQPFFQSTKEEDPLHWYNVPLAKQAFKNLLLSCIDHLERHRILIPPIVQLSQDHHVENRFIGTQCVFHLLSHSESDWEKTGIGEIFYRTLVSSLSFDDEALISSCFDSLLAHLSTEQRNDELMQYLIDELRIGRRMKECFFRQLCRLLPAMNMAIMAHFQDLAPVLLENAREQKELVLESCQIIWELCQPRIQLRKSVFESIKALSV